MYSECITVSNVKQERPWNTKLLFLSC